MISIWLSWRNLSINPTYLAPCFFMGAYRVAYFKHGVFDVFSRISYSSTPKTTSAPSDMV